MLVSNNKVLKINNKWLNSHAFTPYTIRLKYKQGTTPTFSKGTGVLVDSTNNIWDLTYNNTVWSYLLQSHADLIEVIDGNTNGVVNMDRMFYNCSSLTSVSLFNTSKVTSMSLMFKGCTSLTTVPLFDTSKVSWTNEMFANCTSLTNVPLFDTSSVKVIGGMFYNCSSLTSVPLFNTSKVTNMGEMLYECESLTSVPLFDTSKVLNMDRAFANCFKVESGALALYQQASTQASVPRSYTNTFSNCGRDTTTGAAELTQIPSSWGGTGA